MLKKISLLTLLLTCSALAIYRMNVVRENEMAWDVLGYYLYLPATFVHHDPLLNDISWLKKENEKRNLAGTLYMVSSNDKGEPMYFFLMGMSFFYLPFFLLAHLICSIGGIPLDGFSTPYQYCLVLGGVIYTVIGLIFFRKILLRFFPETISALIMLIVVVGTNYINHLTIDNLATINIIFMLTTIILWNTIKWHENYKGKHFFIICIGVALITLVKPSEVFVFLLPLFWKVNSFQDLRNKLTTIFSNKKILLLTIGACLLLAMPQMMYWYLKTGKLVYDSYKNPGVGLDFLSPHILEILFSYRKGWLLYTPVISFALIGFYFLYKRNKEIFPACLVYFLVCFYIISCWSEWWYGAAFSARTLIATYPVLGICMGYFLTWLKERNLILKFSIGALFIFFIFLNQFQWWQYKNWILDPYRTTKEYYWATFLKTKATDEDKKLLSVYRSFSGMTAFSDSSEYQSPWVQTINFDELDDEYIQTSDNNWFYHFKEDQEFYSIYECAYEELTAKDHIWIKASMDIRFPKDFNETEPCLVMSMERKEGAYAYHAPSIKKDSANTEKWGRVESVYLTPEIRSSKDKFKCYIWKRSKQTFDIDNIKLEVYKKK